MIHSELDYRLPISEGLSMFNVLQARKVDSKLLMFPDENHVSHRVSFLRGKLFRDADGCIVGTQAGELSCVAQHSLGLDQQVCRS